MSFQFRLKLLFCLQLNSYSSLVSVATVLVSCSASASITSNSSAHSCHSKGIPETSANLIFGRPLGSPVSWNLLLVYFGAMLFGFGSPLICYERCAWDIDFSLWFSLLLKCRLGQMHLWYCHQNWFSDLYFPGNTGTLSLRWKKSCKRF